MAVTVQHIEDRLGRSLNATEQIRALAAIEDTYALARAYSLISTVETAAQTAVVARVALRAFRNPAGYTQQTNGDVSVSYGSTAQPGVYFTAADMAEMRGRRAGVYSVPFTQPI